MADQKVNVTSFARAETHRMMAGLQRDAGGINRFEHNRAVNNITARHNDDGSVTVRFGGDGDPERNSLPITEGWNYLVRLYRPRTEILSEAWTFPTLAR